jgi:uncharacterized protein YdbL (DUF1318 family)
MKPVNQRFRVLLFLAAFLIGACVTINIYFPAEKVESVAGEIVDDIRGQKTAPQTAPEKKDQSKLERRPLLASLMPTARAEEVTTVSNAAIRELKDRMKARFPQLKPWFDSGVLKEGNDGFVAVASMDGVGVKDKGTVRNLVAAENKDRQSLYREVAKALNIDASQTERVAAIFAKEWQKSLK